MDRWSSCIAYLICGYFIPDHVARQPATVWMASVQRTRKDQELIDKEATFYDVYNNMAEKFDQEMIKDWTESLTFLLVFVRIDPISEYHV